MSGGDWPILLAYHHISESTTTRYVMKATEFERQLQRLLEHGYTPLTLDEAIEHGPFGTGDAPERSFSVTFDDGLSSLKDFALPALQRLGLADKTTAFVPTAFVGARNAWRAEPTTVERLRKRTDLDEPLLSWDELQQVAEAGVRIESHGHGHLPMQELSYDEALADAIASRDALRAHGFSARYFALPYGYLSDTAKRAVADAGFDAAFSVTHGGRDRFEVRRVPVYGTDGATTWSLKTSGRYFRVFDAAKRALGRGGEA